MWVFTVYYMYVQDFMVHLDCWQMGFSLRVTQTSVQCLQSSRDQGRYASGLLEKKVSHSPFMLKRLALTLPEISREKQTASSLWCIEKQLFTTLCYICLSTDHQEKHTNVVCKRRRCHFSLTTITSWTLKQSVTYYISKDGS